MVLKNQKNIRKTLRKLMPKSEVVLWQKLRSDYFGYKFRRQYSVGNYVADFYCPELKLVVEIA